MTKLKKSLKIILTTQFLFIGLFVIGQNPAKDFPLQKMVQ